METRFRVGNNAVQPLLLMFPLGSFSMAIIFDVATVAGAPRLLGTVAYGNIIAGLLGGAAAAGILSIDVMVTRQVRAARLGTVGVLFDFGVLIVFTVVALTRLRTDYREADSGLLVVEVVALTVAGFSTWIGGRLGPHSLVPHRMVPQRGPRRGNGG